MKIRASISSLRGPLRRMVPMPPCPAGVAIATIVSSYMAELTQPQDHHGFVVIFTADLERPRLDPVLLEAERCVEMSRGVGSGDHQVNLLNAFYLSRTGYGFLNQSPAQV